MKIAFISFEFPPETGFGGIGTYVHQASRMLADRGNHVEVFSASFNQDYSEENSGLLVHRIKCERQTFSTSIISIFKERQEAVGFEIVESPEYWADGLEVFKLFDTICSVVKTHTPTFLLEKISSANTVTFLAELRFFLGALRRWHRPFFLGKQYQKQHDLEYQIAKIARAITTPSKSLGTIVQQEWSISKEKILHQPYPFVPPAKLLNIDINSKADKTVTFIGRLEIRKGLLVLLKAIPAILKADPDVTFHFIGKPMNSPNPDYDMQEYFQLKLKGYEKHLKFYGSLDLSGIAKVLEKTSVCVFPSIWENFPNVCLEAMSAGRAIVGTHSGGMAEQLADGAGILIPPNNPKAITKAILSILKDDDLRITLGRTARSKVLTEYNSEVIGALMEEQYKTIAQKGLTVGIKK